MSIKQFADMLKECNSILQLFGLQNCVVNRGNFYLEFASKLTND